MPKKEKIQNYDQLWRALLGFMAVFVIGAALTDFYKIFEKEFIENPQFPFFDLTTNGRVSLLQIFTFLFLVARFYGGAYRFQEWKKFCSNLNRTVDLLFSFFLFVFFYFMAESMDQKFFFILAIFVLHSLDLGWFILSGLFFPLRPGLREVANTFIFLSLITVGLCLIFLTSGDANLWGKGELNNFSTFLIFLLLISLLDFLFLWKFYFDPEKWFKGLEK